MLLNMDLKNKIKDIFDSSYDAPQLINHKTFDDNRGLFYEQFNDLTFHKFLKNEKISFVQDNISVSKKGVIRGLHFQTAPYGQGKYISVLSGAIFDIFLDIRKHSNSFGCWSFHILDSQNKESLWIPEGFAHGFQALEKNSTVHYKATNFYNQESEKTIHPLDSYLSINWPLDLKIISEKDMNGKKFKDFLF